MAVTSPARRLRPMQHQTPAQGEAQPQQLLNLQAHPVEILQVNILRTRPGKDERDFFVALYARKNYH
jgi:hypothetical protein